ncbi:MAG: VOC family protein [Bacteroidetes bacterium]|nr:VOC family protein [Bacteroidota bacterium]
MKIPPQYNQLMPYLILHNTPAFKTFMQTVFHAEEQLTVAGANSTIAHGEMKLGQSVFMYSEASEAFPVMNAGLFIHVDNADITYQAALEAGAVVVPGQEPSDKEYGRACGVLDPFGNTWWITSVS